MLRRCVHAERRVTEVALAPQAGQDEAKDLGWGPSLISERVPYLSERWSAIQPPVVSDRLWPGLLVRRRARQQSFGSIVGLLAGCCRRTPRTGSPGHEQPHATGSFLGSHPAFRRQRRHIKQPPAQCGRSGWASCRGSRRAGCAPPVHACHTFGDRFRGPYSHCAMTTTLTPDEFKLIQSCLHPDREASVEHKTKAFAIFKRLDPSADPLPSPKPPAPSMRPAQQTAPMPPTRRKPRL